MKQLLKAREVELLENTSVAAAIVGAIDAVGIAAENVGLVPTDGCAPCYLPCLNTAPWNNYTFVNPPAPELCSYCQNSIHTC